jgi:hypothetical protein
MFIYSLNIPYFYPLNPPEGGLEFIGHSTVRGFQKLQQGAGSREQGARSMVSICIAVCGVWFTATGVCHVPCEKLANSLKETDNPVLMIVRLKK